MKLVNQISLVTTITIAFLVISCGVQKTPAQSELSGTYASVGYGRVLKIEEGEFILADITKYSCLPLMEGKIADFKEFIYLKNDTLNLKQGINIYQFTKIVDAPPVCEKGSSACKMHKQKRMIQNIILKYYGIPLKNTTLILSYAM